MYKIKGIFNKLNKENTSDEKESNQDLICFVCNSVINYGQAYISDEELNVYCSEECYLKQLNSKYY
ncbi:MULTISPECIES: hypothetical protein [unclassified Clostridium]|uniref:hypothetical protein n=1 Tax=unclassified Clostridium TaxID=2614128 RepID=UPI00290F2506|nr:hypothetical protein [Clostridium sp.]MDU5107951.1 hypothetical protein [Clostridium sp.]